MKSVSKKILRGDILSSLFIFSFFILFSILLPIYDEVNGFYNLIFDEYELTWHDGRSPLNFHFISNFLMNKQISFSKEYFMNNQLQNYLFDLIEINGKYYLRYPAIGNYIFIGMLYFFPLSSNLQIFKTIIFLIILFSAGTLVLFYKIQILLNLKRKFALVSSIISGVATSILIYSRYLFLNELMYTFIFMLFLYFLFKYWGKSSNRIDIFLSVIFSIFLLVFSYNFLPFLLLSYFFFKYKLIRSYKIYFLTLTITFFIFFLWSYTSPFSRSSREVFKEAVLPPTYGPVRIYPHYIPALDYSIYGYHNLTSIRKLDRYFAYIYAFQEKAGNAIFLFTHGLFGSLFGPKGFVYNSPFLIFSIFGIFIYKQKRKRNFLTFTIFLIIISVSFTFMWYGGVTPRYIRHYNIPILLLSFFSFYYIQEVSKEKNKTKKYLVYVIFITLTILSILNVSSLAVRADWTYEHEANLVSYDLVLWPWYPPKPQENVVNLYLTELGESVEWKFGGRIGGCKAYGDLSGIVTPLCNCEFASYAEREIDIPWKNIRINITACSREGDGVIGRFYFDRIEKEIIIPSEYTCQKISFIIKNSEGKHTLMLKPKIYKRCVDEIVIWKLITIEEI